jgi:hypothetical protein
MNLYDIKSKLNLTSLFENLEKEKNIDVKKVYTSDLLSDILANSPKEALFVTIQAHINTLAIAKEKKALGIIICNNRQIPKDFMQIAQDEKIPIFVGPKNV